MFNGEENMLHKVLVMTCHARLKHGSGASVTTQTSAYGLGLSLTP